MNHLDLEALARLVDELPSLEERRHLRSCSRCARELAGMIEQTQRLSRLPPIEPPPEAWEAVEGRLIEEGLVREDALAPTSDASRRPSRWLQAVAGVLLFMSGGVLGAAVAPGFAPGGSAEVAFPDGPAVGDPVRDLGDWDAVSLESAEELVRLTQDWHLDALFLYRDRMEAVTGVPVTDDPVLRFVVLENLVSITEAGVRESPADPFLNGLLVSAVAERQAAWEGISFASGGTR